MPIFIVFVLVIVVVIVVLITIRNVQTLAVREKWRHRSRTGWRSGRRGYWGDPE